MKKKIILPLLALFLLFATGALVTAIYISKTTTTLNRLIELHQIEILREGLVINLQTVQSDLYTVHTPLGQRLDSIVKNVEKLDEAANRCRSCHHSRELARRIAEVQDLIVDYKNAVSYYITVSADIKRIEKIQLDAAAIGNKLLGLTQEMTFTAGKRLQQMTSSTLLRIKNARIILFGTVLFAFILGLWISVHLTRAVTRPVNEIVSSVRMVASGHLGYKTAYDDRTEFGELARNFNSMSERLKEEREHIIQSTKLAAIGELASNVAHEINNPLTSIIGFIELMKDEKDASVIKNYLSIVEKESKRARDIVRELLRFARKRPLELSELDINAVIRDIIPLTKAQMRANHIELIEEYGELPRILGDANQLTQVFVNIINNAIAAMEHGGKLVIRTAHHGEEIVVDFEDTGRGIPKEIVRRIFEPFFTTKKDRGTGLGLSVSYRIIQDHGGRIDVSSTEGQGSTFTVQLPVKASFGISSEETEAAKTFS